MPFLYFSKEQRRDGTGFTIFNLTQSCPLVDPYFWVPPKFNILVTYIRPGSNKPGTDSVTILYQEGGQPQGELISYTWSREVSTDDDFCTRFDPIDADPRSFSIEIETEHAKEIDDIEINLEFTLVRTQDELDEILNFHLKA